MKINKKSVIEFRIKPQGEVLEAYHRDEGRNVFIMGPLGSGKTIETCQKLFLKMCQQEPNAEGVRPTRCYAVRNTYPDLETTTIKDWLELFGDIGRFVNAHPPIHYLDFELEDGTQVKSELIFLAMDRLDHVKKLRGAQASWFWLNETKELPKAVVDMADLRHGRYPSMAAGGVKPTGHGMLGDYNAPDEDHWLFRLAEEEKPAGWSFHRQPGGVIKQGGVWVENPNAENLSNLPDGYYINGMAGKSEDWIKVNLANEYGFAIDGKPIHPDYVDSFHVATEVLKPVPGLTVYIGMDYGLTPAAAFAQRTPDGQWRFFKEFVCEDAGAIQLADTIGPYMRGELAGFDFQIWGDPAGESGSEIDRDQNVFKILQAEGIDARPCDSNDPVLRRGAMASQLRKVIRGKPAILFCPSMKVMRKGLAGAFCYKRIQVAGDERYRDKPDKTPYSHIVEAGEYLLMGAGEGHAIVKRKHSPAQQVVRVKSNFNVF